MSLSDKEGKDFSDHRGCRLGKWYYEGDGRTSFAQLPGFREMEQPHARFHENGMAAVRLFKEGNQAAGFGAVERMEQASLEVLACLEKVAASGDEHIRLSH
ncbi:MAG: CZB domain-containing protein [Rhodocyclaceae bacterium]|nr:CZB domain-containing protein [Rhodocyclaceae bacterium]